MKLIVGLGNVGKRYAHTRHNIGFMVVEALARTLQTQSLSDYNSSLIGKTSVPSATPSWKPEPKLQAVVAVFDLDAEKLVLAKPQTMMNGSGAALQRLMQKYRVKPDDVWVIFDDVDVPFGRLRLRTGGNSGSGHQGVNSIISAIGINFVRVKVGISLNDRSVEPSEVYVLKPFTESEQAQLPRVISTAAGIVSGQLTADSPEDATFDLLRSI